MPFRPDSEMSTKLIAKVQAKVDQLFEILESDPNLKIFNEARSENFLNELEDITNVFFEGPIDIKGLTNMLIELDEKIKNYIASLPQAKREVNLQLNTAQKIEEWFDEMQDNIIFEMKTRRAVLEKTEIAKDFLLLNYENTDIFLDFLDRNIEKIFKTGLKGSDGGKNEKVISFFYKLMDMWAKNFDQPEGNEAKIINLYEINAKLLKSLDFLFFKYKRNEEGELIVRENLDSENVAAIISAVKQFITLPVETYKKITGPNISQQNLVQSSIFYFPNNSRHKVINRNSFYFLSSSFYR